MRFLISEQWNEFARMNLPVDYSPLKCREMRKAFYAGAEGMFEAIMVKILREPEMTASNVDLMLGVERELKWFAQLVEDGRA